MYSGATVYSQGSMFLLNTINTLSTLTLKIKIPLSILFHEKLRAVLTQLTKKPTTANY